MLKMKFDINKFDVYIMGKFSFNTTTLASSLKKLSNTVKAQFKNWLNFDVCVV